MVFLTNRIEIEAVRLEKDSILTNDSGINIEIVALVVYSRGLGLHRRYRLVFLEIKPIISVKIDKVNPRFRMRLCVIGYKSFYLKMSMYVYLGI